MTEYRTTTTITVKIFKSGDISESALQNIERLLKDYGAVSITTTTEHRPKLPSASTTLG